MNATMNLVMNITSLNNVTAASKFTHDKLIIYLNIYLCSFLIVIGIIGNFLSLIIFIRSSFYSPKIVTRYSLILLTVSNSIYLILFWYISILPSFNVIFKISSDNILKKIHLLSNTNVIFCKMSYYLINVCLCLNALITVSFSLERAIAINFPLKSRNLRKNHPFMFKIINVCIILLAFLFPVYTIVVLEIKYFGHTTKCLVIEKYEKLYFKLTVIFVFQTLALPFLIITLSNISILVALYNNKILLRNYKKERNIKISTTQLKSEENQSDLAADFVPKLDKEKSSLNRFSSFVSYSNSNTKLFRKTVANLNLNSNSNQKPNEIKLLKHFMITKMLVTISACFVLFNFPYFIAWCIYVIAKVFHKKSDFELIKWNNFLKLTHILLLMNYSVTCFLYFASGKLYRQHLFALFGCKTKQKRFKAIQMSTKV